MKYIFKALGKWMAVVKIRSLHALRYDISIEFDLHKVKYNTKANFWTEPCFHICYGMNLELIFVTKIIHYSWKQFIIKW